MRRALLYVLAAVLLVVIAAVTWYTRETTGPLTYTVHAGDTLETIAATHGITIAALINANSDIPPEQLTSVGAILVLPRVQPSISDAWLVHGAGVVTEIVGVLVGFWLAIAGGVLARRARAQVMSIAVVLAVASYIAAQLNAGDTPSLTARFLFDAFKDGFFWVALFAMLTQLLRMRDAATEPRAEGSETTPSPA
jgi:hypothetical protein